MILVNEYIHHLEQSFVNAAEKKSKCTRDIFRMEGMSGDMTRCFYNNLLSKSDVRYLEIGVWKGSSVCSAMCGNQAVVTCIDNWSQFNGPKNECLDNISKFKGDNTVQVVEADAFEVDVSKFTNKFNVYMYDGDHRREDHERALTHYHDAMDDVFIYVVDDWNWDFVRKGTYDGIEKLGLDIEYKKEIFTPNNGTRDSWWNGIVAFVLKKNPMCRVPTNLISHVRSIDTVN
jgi:hypothetical protein